MLECQAVANMYDHGDEGRMFAAEIVPALQRALAFVQRLFL